MTTAPPSTALAWLARHVKVDSLDIQPLINEASTRSFWRCVHGSKSWILIISPPTSENNEQFVKVANIFRGADVPVPFIIDHDYDNGFFLVEDVGNRDFYQEYVAGRVTHCLDLALDTLLKIQSIRNETIPKYTDSRLALEIGIFEEFICNRLLRIESKIVPRTTNKIVLLVDKLPRTTIHRDFHCRNLLVRNEAPFLGVVDFQDALFGPITYDLASLLFDCYWTHTNVEIDSRIEQFFNNLVEQDASFSLDPYQFATAVKITAVQRLLKAAGIFCRLWIVRNQATHLKYVVPTLQKARDICTQESLVQSFGDWLDRNVVDQVAQRINTDFS